MADEDMLFDPSMKKKKKKKTPLNLDDEDDTTKKEPEPEPVKEETKEDDDINEKRKDDDLDLEDFSKMKKKKKKKKPLDMDALNEALPDTSGENKENEEAKDENQEESKNVIIDDDEFSFGKKKKKPKSKKPVTDETDGTQPNNDAMEDESHDNKVDTRDEERDYTYDELLKRVFDIMRAKNPAMIEGGKKKFVLKPPQVVKIGTKKTSFVNFPEICRLLHRQPKHLLAFLLAELGTSGSVDGNNQLIIKGRFQQKQIENVLRRYIKEYVTCHTCRSPDTILHKETRLFFLQCETCGSRCSVASIKSGFQALTGKRAALKNKQ